MHYETEEPRPRRPRGPLRTALYIVIAWAAVWAVLALAIARGYLATSLDAPTADNPPSRSDVPHPSNERGNIGAGFGS